MAATRREAADHVRRSRHGAHHESGHHARQRAEQHEPPPAAPDA
ncbi:MAG: hypothetical protein R2746_14410 [Acidimicrobiales bacterium]